MDGILSSILTPGTGPGLLSTLNGILLLLLALLATLALLGEGDVHTAVMAAIVLGLLASVNWFISLVQASEGAEEREGAVEASKDGEQEGEGGAQEDAATAEGLQEDSVAAALGGSSATSARRRRKA